MKDNHIREYRFNASNTFLSVFIIKCPAYNETIKLHTYHKRRMIWATTSTGGKSKTGFKRTRMILRFCKQCCSLHSDEVFMEGR